LLSDADRTRLLEAAKDVAARAYAPYSDFRVGAAVLTEQGTVHAGCNVENASYGLTICAERNALFQMVATAPRPIAVRAILVYTPTDSPTAPCGACRQVLNEFGPSCDVLCVCDGLGQIATTLDQLIPSAFGPRNLA
jgi:cytidine deaminase